MVKVSTLSKNCCQLQFPFFTFKESTSTLLVNPLNSFFTNQTLFDFFLKGEEKRIKRKQWSPGVSLQRNAVFLIITVAVVIVNLISIIIFVKDSYLRTRSMYLVINLTVQARSKHKMTGAHINSPPSRPPLRSLG